MLVKITTKHAIVSPVILVTHKHFFFSSVMFSKLTNQNQKTVILLVKYGKW